MNFRNFIVHILIGSFAASLLFFPLIFLSFIFDRLILSSTSRRIFSFGLCILFWLFLFLLPLVLLLNASAKSPLSPFHSTWRPHDIPSAYSLRSRRFSRHFSPLVGSPRASICIVWKDEKKGDPIFECPPLLAHWSEIAVCPCGQGKDNCIIDMIFPRHILADYCGFRRNGAGGKKQNNNKLCTDVRKLILYSRFARISLPLKAERMNFVECCVNIPIEWKRALPVLVRKVNRIINNTGRRKLRDTNFFFPPPLGSRRFTDRRARFQPREWKR